MIRHVLNASIFRKSDTRMIINSDAMTRMTYHTRMRYHFSSGAFNQRMNIVYISHIPYKVHLDAKIARRTARRRINHSNNDVSLLLVIIIWIARRRSIHFPKVGSRFTCARSYDTYVLSYDFVAWKFVSE